MNPILLHNPLFLKDVLKITEGKLYFSTVNQKKFSKLATDTRCDLRDALFVAIKGENFDGHTFLKQAQEKGASYALVEDLAHCPRDFPSILVSNTKIALGKLANWVREEWDGEVFAITGSNGKTTTKEMLFAILNGAWDDVAATKGNLNNDLGVPFTLLPLACQRAVVVEMGMNHQGEIAYLSHIAQPNVALITNAGRAHLSGLKNVENVAKEKADIFKGLQKNGIAVLPKFSPFFEMWQKSAKNCRIFSYAFDDESADLNAHLKNEGARFVLCLEEGEIPLQVLGKHNAENALAAVAMAKIAHIPFSYIQKALMNFQAPLGRLHLKNSGKWQVIDDTYNANPESMRAAINVLSTVNHKKILVLGDMGEVGENAAQMHAEIGAFAKEKGIDALFALGNFSKLAAKTFGENAKFFENEEMLVAELKKENTPAVILVKGSRFMRMEKIVEALCS